MRHPGVVPSENLDARIARARQDVVNDCGCPDLYFCPRSDSIECPRHSGFDVCCDRPGDHISVR
jgi:hypothetical protein